MTANTNSELFRAGARMRSAEERRGVAEAESAALKLKLVRARRESSVLRTELNDSMVHQKNAAEADAACSKVVNKNHRNEVAKLESRIKELEILNARRVVAASSMYAYFYYAFGEPSDSDRDLFGAEVSDEARELLAGLQEGDDGKS